MIVEAQVTINGSKAAIWSAITNIENASEIISGIEKIEILEKPAGGLVGPAVAAAVLFLFAARARLARVGLYGLALLLALSVLMVVRNPFGMGYVSVVAVLLVLFVLGAFKPFDIL